MTFKQNYITVKKEDGENPPVPTLLYFSKDIMDTMGVARLEFPYKEETKKMLKVGTEKVIINGGLTSGTTERIFYGKVTENKRVEDTLSISLIDYGSNFKKNCQATFTDERLEDVLKKLIKEVDFKAILKNISPEVLDKKISQSATSETPAAGGVATGPGVTGAGLKSCARCSLKEGKPNYYQSTVENKCPMCGKAVITWVQGSGYHTCDKEDNAGVEGMYTCCLKKGGCDTDFCICGRNHTDSYKDIRVLSQPAPVSGAITLSDASGIKSGSPTPTAGTTGNETSGTPVSAAKTYEDVINQICADENLYMYLDQEKNCYIQEFKGEGKPEYEITPGMIPRNMYTYVNGEDEDKAFEVKVKYKNGEISKFFGDKEKVKKENIQKYDKPELDQSKAEELAQNVINQTLREQKIELGIRSLASPSMYPGKWVKVPTINNFNKKEVMYVCGVATVVRPKSPINYDITLKYAPPIPELATGATGNPISNLPSIEAIAKKAATFTYSHSCSKASCLESTGQGDCYAMSNWLYNKLTAIGIKAQILWCSGPNNHRTVQIDNGSGWVDFPYKGNGYEIQKMFRVSSSRSGCRIYGGPYD